MDGSSLGLALEGVISSPLSSALKAWPRARKLVARILLEGLDGSSLDSSALDGLGGSTLGSALDGLDNSALHSTARSPAPCSVASTARC